MAIAFRSHGTVTTATPAANAAVAVGNATTVAINDVLVLGVIGGSGITAITAPTGWTQLVPRTVASLGFVYAAYKVAVLADTTAANYSMGTTGPGGVGLVGAISAYSGCDTTTPIDATSTTGLFSNSTTANCPTITTVTANAMLLGLVGTVTATITFTSAVETSRWTAAASLESAGFGDLAQAVAGASGTKAWTASAKCAGPTATMALRPAGGAAPADLPLSTGAALSAATIAVTAPSVATRPSQSLRPRALPGPLAPGMFPR